METKETKEANKTSEPSRQPLIKNICYDMDLNKLTINDSENRQYLCDIFGRKKIKFLPYITGTLNRYRYPNLSQEKTLSNLHKTNLSTKKISSKKYNNIGSPESNFTNNMILNKKYTDYFPTIRKFEGYSKFPRPVGPPLTNIPKYEIKEKDKRKLINKLNKYFDDKSTKNDIIRKNENIGLSYLTGDLNEYDTIRHDTEHTIKLIDKTLENFREEYRLKLNIMHKNPNVRALNEFKKNLLLNKNAKVINGRALDGPSDKIKKNYRIIQSLVNNTGLSYDKKIEKHKLSSIYNKIKYNRKNKTLSDFENKYNVKNISIILGPDKLNDVCKTKDFTIGRLINMDFGSSPSSNKNQSVTEANLSKDLNKNQNISKEITTNRNNESNKITVNDEVYKETEETATNNANASKINENTSKLKTLDERINDNEISFISYMSDNEKKYEKENILTIKSNRNINRMTEHYNKLLLGYKEKERKPMSIFHRTRALNLKTDGDLYRENINLLRLTNREAFKIQEQKELYDLKLLEKKIKISAINATNVMKGKTLSPKKDKQKQNS
jgi:hypothetical protein